jgi:hypothetical protein
MWFERKLGDELKIKIMWKSIYIRTKEKANKHTIVEYEAVW